MNSTKWDFPHPLLIEGNDDYISGSFSLVEGKHITKEDEFEFCFSYSLTCPGLEKYILEHHAEVEIFAASSASKFRERRCFSYGEKAIRFPVLKNNIVKSVDFTAFIVATGDEKFTLPEHNPEYYHGTTFTLRKGDILAISSTTTVDLDDSELQKPLASIFKISESPDSNAAPNFNDDKIEVFLPPDTYGTYDKLKAHYPTIRRNLSAVVTLPALTEAIEIMRLEDTLPYQDYRWFRALNNRLSQHEIDINETEMQSMEIANLIYGDIISDALGSLKDLLDKVYDDGDDLTELGALD